MSKYNDFMSHVRVDDEMHRRIMDAVSEAIKENAGSKNETVNIKAEVQPLNSNAKTTAAKPARRSVIPLIRGLSIAAAAVLVVGGAIMLASRSGGTKTASTQRVNNYEAALETTAAEQIDGALGITSGNSYTMDKNKKTAGDAETGGKKSITGNLGIKGTTAATVAGGVDSDIPRAENKEEDEGVRAASPSEEADTKDANGDIRDSLPFKVKSVKTGAFTMDISMTVYTGTNGEKAVLLTAKEGTDIVKAYYPDFEGIPASLQTEGGQEFKAIDTFAGRNVLVKNAGPFDAVTWTKNGTTYMLEFNSKTDAHVFISIMDKI